MGNVIQPATIPPEGLAETQPARAVLQSTVFITDLSIVLQSLSIH